VTLFHSARVLEPGEYDYGANADIGISNFVLNDNLALTMPISTPPFSFFGKWGFQYGTNLGAYIGLPYVGISLQERIISESKYIPSVSMTFEFCAVYFLFHREYDYFLSVDLFKNQIIKNPYLNPSMRLRFGRRFIETANVADAFYFYLEDENCVEASLILGNEIGTFDGLNFFPYCAVSLPYFGQFPIQDYNKLIEVDLGITFFFKNTRNKI
jgi:hypothetical protein